MKLYLVRHGDYSASGIEQQDVLNEKGINDIKQLVNFLLPLQIRVNSFLHSGKIRAQQTAEILSQGIACDQSIQARDGLNPNDDVTAFATEITHWEGDVCVVGHLPFMSKLVSYLVIGNQNKEIMFFHTGTIVCLELLDSTRWMIQWVWGPVMG